MKATARKHPHGGYVIRIANHFKSYHVSIPWNEVKEIIATIRYQDCLVSAIGVMDEIPKREIMANSMEELKLGAFWACGQSIDKWTIELRDGAEVMVYVA
jgi:hypothetical protein